MRDYLHRLIDEESMLQPVHSRCVERRGVSEAHRAAHRLRRAGAQSRVIQRVERQLHCEVAVLVFTKAEFVWDVLLPRQEGIKLAEQRAMAGIRTVEKVLAAVWQRQLLAERRNPARLVHYHPPERARMRSAGETAAHSHYGYRCRIHPPHPYARTTPSPVTTYL